MHVKFSMGTKHAVKGYGIVPFWMESGGTLRMQDLLRVIGLKRSVIPVLMIEKNGFDFMF
jgi:hypothetical protein